MVGFIIFLVIATTFSLCIILPIYFMEKDKWDERILGWLEKGNPDSHINKHQMIEKTVTHGQIYTTYWWKCTCGYKDNSSYKSLAKDDYLKHRISTRKKAQGKGEW